jgi:putative multiple sugar transport system substrate-binding protein
MCSIKNRASAEKVVEDVAEAPAEGAGEGIVVGVVMPTKSLQRWNQDGSNMKEQLEAKGFEVDLLFLHLVGLSIY